MMNLLEKLNEAINDVYDHVGYDVSKSGAIEIDDNAENYWTIMGESSIGFGEDKKDVLQEDGNYYLENIEKKIYRGNIYTAVVMTMEGYPNCGKVLAVFENTKELKEE